MILIHEIFIDFHNVWYCWIEKTSLIPGMGFALLKVVSKNVIHHDTRENRYKGVFEGIVTVFQITGPVFIRMESFLDWSFARPMAIKCRARFPIFLFNQILCFCKFSVGG